MKIRTYLLLMTLLVPAAEAAVLIGEEVDLAAGTRTCRYSDGSFRIVRITQDCRRSYGRHLIREERIGSTGWRCWYTDGSYVQTTSGRCPQD